MQIDAPCRYLEARSGGDDLGPYLNARAAPAKKRLGRPHSAVLVLLVTMKLSTALLSALLPFAAANAAAASHRGALHAFQRAEGVKKAFNEKREAAAAAAAPRAAPQLQKRASPFATNATQSTPANCFP